jgi:hypothetical protein
MVAALGMLMRPEKSHISSRPRRIGLRPGRAIILTSPRRRAGRCRSRQFAATCLDAAKHSRTWTPRAATSPPRGWPTPERACRGNRSLATLARPARRAAATAAAAAAETCVVADASVGPLAHILALPSRRYTPRGRSTLVDVHPRRRSTGQSRPGWQISKSAAPGAPRPAATFPVRRTVWPRAGRRACRAAAAAMETPGPRRGSRRPGTT